MCARFLVIAFACLTAGCGSRLVPPTAGSGPTSKDGESSSRRPVYPYSVIAGGVQNREELRRATVSDAVVQEHYRNVDTRTLVPVRLQHDQFAYVSFRRSGRVYWTSRKVRLTEGEVVLANSSRACVRARCGNRIASEPQKPTLDKKSDEPTEAELLTPVPASGVPYDVATESPVGPKSGRVKEPSSPDDVQIPPAEKENETSRWDSVRVWPSWFIGEGPATWMTVRIPPPAGPTTPPVEPPGIVLPEPVIPPAGRVQLSSVEAWIVFPSNVAGPPQPDTTLLPPPGIAVLPPPAVRFPDGGSSGGGVIPPAEYHDGGNPPSNPGGGGGNPPPPPPVVHETPEPSAGALVMGGLFVAVIRKMRARQ